MPNFNADAIRRIARQTRKGELAKPGGIAPRPDAPRPSAFGAWFRVTTAFTAATDSGTVLTFGTGAAKRQRPDPANRAKRIDAGYAAITNIYNSLNGTIAVGKIVWAVPDNGDWIIDLVWC